MLTLRRIVLERNAVVKSWVDNCMRSGTARLARHILEDFLNSYDLSIREISDFLHNEYGIETFVNDTHYVLSRSELQRVF